MPSIELRHASAFVDLLALLKEVNENGVSRSINEKISAWIYTTNQIRWTWPCLHTPKISARETGCGFFLQVALGLATYGTLEPEECDKIGFAGSCQAQGLWRVEANLACHGAARRSDH